MSTPTKTEDEPKETDFSVIVQAIKLFLIENTPVREAVRAYNVPRTNLQRYLKKVSEKFNDVSAVQDGELMEFLRKCSQRTPSNMIFNQYQEEDLVQYILKCVGHYYGLSITELRELAYQLAKKIGSCPDGWNHEKMAPRHWYYKFMKRHPQLVLRTPEQTSMNRTKAFCKSNVDRFFENFHSVLSSGHDFGATQIFNMDESGFSTVPSKIEKVIALKGMRRVGKMEAAERGTMITMAFDNVSSGTAGYANDSDRMCQPEFVRFMHHFIVFAKPSLASPVILLMDNHRSHLCVEVGQKVGQTQETNKEGF